MEREALEYMLRGLCEKIEGEGIVYWQASRGTAPRLHTFPENCSTNIFAWAKQKPIEDLRKPLKLITHENCELILPVTVRAHLLSVCGEFGIPTSERPFTVDEIYAANEVMITSATTFFRFADWLDGKPVGGRDRATVEKRQRAYMRRIADVTGRVPAVMRDFME